jgi:hypothetical protein
MGALLERAAQEGAIAALLNALADACWPGGELAPPAPPRSRAARAAREAAARAALSKAVAYPCVPGPGRDRAPAPALRRPRLPWRCCTDRQRAAPRRRRPLALLLGRDGCEQVAARVHASCRVQTLNRHFVLCAADVLVRELFPEVGSASGAAPEVGPAPELTGAAPEADPDEEERGPTREAALEAALRAAVEQVERLSQEVEVLRRTAGADAGAGAAMDATVGAACTSASTRVV